MSNDVAIESLQTKIDHLNQQAWSLRVHDSQKSFEISKEAIELAKTISYTKGLAEGLRAFGFCNMRLSNHDKAYPDLKESLALFESLNDLAGQSEVTEILGVLERVWGNLGNSLELLLKAIDLATQTGNEEDIATSNYQLGVTYKHLGDYENALDHFYNSIALTKKLGNALYESYSINLIGSVYFETGEYQKALEYYLQGLPMRQAAGDKWGEAGSLDNIGFTYLKLKDYKQADEYCKRSLEITKNTGDKKGQANTLLHLAEISKESNDLSRAEEFFSESLQIWRAMGDKRGEAEVLLLLAGLHKASAEKKNPDEFLQWLSRALMIAEEIKAMDIQSRARRSLYEFYTQTGNYKEAIIQLELHINLEKELHKNAINQKVLNLEISHKAEEIKKEAETERLRNKELVELNEQIEKANAELRIEASLERVRAVAMGMKDPADMINVCRMISQELQQLGFKEIRNVQTVIIYTQKHEYLNYQYFTPYDKESIEIIDYRLHPDVLEFTNRMLSSPDAYYTKTFEGEELKVWREYRKQTNQLPDPKLDATTSSHYYFYSIGAGALGVTTYAPLNEDQIDLFKRFRNVFDLAYRRFIDIEKALAQAKEAQIEAALERVRSRSMAMHKSDELREVVAVLFAQLQHLGFNINFCSIALIDKVNSTVEFWLSGFSQEILPESYHVPNIDHPFYQNFQNTFRSGTPYAVFELAGEQKRSYDKLWFTLTDFKNLPVPVKKPMMEMERVVLSCAFTKNGMIQIGGFEPLSDNDASIIQRFAKVFEQTYTRFLDLQKAEAQAREAQIEAALEKVRAKVMAMQESADLNETSLVFGEQLRKLGIDWQFSYFWLIEEDKDDNTFWITWPDNQTSTTTYSLAEADESFRECIIAWRKQEKIHGTHVPLEHVQAWLDTFERITNDAGGAAIEIMKAHNFKDGVYYYDAMIRFGSFGILMNRATNDEEKNIQSRFAIEFERAYTRFLDLKKAEAQTREANIEVALERVRARALAMQQPEELKDVAQVLRNEMGALGVEELETSSIYIHGESSENVECWYALQDPKHTEKKMVSDHFVLDLNDTWVGREMKKFYRADEKQISVVMRGENRKEWINYCYKHSPVFSGFYGDKIPDRTYHLYKFSHGYIGAAAPGDISAESWKLLSRAASVFSLAYSRFKDLTQARIDLIRLKEEKKRAEDALTELQHTQKQLIQTEKMASLGELTAGIAHEIQNPLNFVNNFSDLSNELMEEMKTELATGNAQQAIELANDVQENLEKILHHGKRADAIVKSMLQHSRSSTGKKELTAINPLCDEYMRLAFHGLRAKDKSFNAKFETYLDKSIDKINVVPQEIGRVILNLINNAFYAVNEKKNKNSNGYDPLVVVSTKKRGEMIEIKVKDNGDGIPQKVLDKIFQPFFTTKPTGQGTGLGLSLSYDIVTKGHGGEIKVETEEGVGSEFIISLPLI